MKSLLKLATFAVAALLFSNSALAQDKSKRASPPMSVSAQVDDANVSINYSAPSAKGRTIWGELVPYGKLWRAGANEATTIETDKDLSIGGKSLPAGKYSLFLIPEEGEWTFVFNSVSDQWGAYQYDESKDVLRVKGKAQSSEAKSELLTYKIEDGKLWLAWADQMGSISLK